MAGAEHEVRDKDKGQIIQLAVVKCFYLGQSS